jgi:hypothetical protein
MHARCLRRRTWAFGGSDSTHRGVFGDPSLRNPGSSRLERLGTTSHSLLRMKNELGNQCSLTSCVRRHSHEGARSIGYPPCSLAR